MARWLGLLSVLFVLGCGSTSHRIASPEATDWEAEVLGGAPDARLVVRVDAAKADPVYGGAPTAYDRRSDPELEALVAAIDSIEMWFVVDDREASRSSVLMVVRGHPGLDELRKDERVRALLSQKPERLPSGVLAYDVSEPHTPVMFFVLPSGAWVIATGRIVGRVRYYLFSHADDPPAAPSEPDAILALWIGKGATRLADVADRAKGFEELSIVLRSSARGDVEISLRFADEKHAKETLATTQALLAQLPVAQKALADRCPAWESVRFELERDHRVLTGRVSNVPALVRAYRTGACRYDRRER